MGLDFPYTPHPTPLHPAPIAGLVSRDLLYAGEANNILYGGLGQDTLYVKPFKTSGLNWHPSRQKPKKLFKERRDL
ncbi:MAG: hypothetical protein F6K28_10900 [Microcoleus sp. SIO2G3]|nr:hypothetical protein [Microcoleus sp. SIO2G3]